jgi:adenosylmethionine-8-amino-7-oxononanoate aminotransferase
MKLWLESEPTVVERAEGFELIDTRGRRFIDGFSSLWCNLHGHRVAAIDQAIAAQLARVAHSTLLGFGSPPSIELAARLVEIMPPCMGGLRKVFFSDSGATAVEVALKMAFQYYRNIGSPRRRFLAFRDGYHGDTVGAVGIGGIDAFHSLFRPLLLEATFVASPCEFTHPAGARAADAVLAEVDAALSAAPREYCAVFIEPLVQAAGGILTQPPGFLRRLRELTARHGVLLVADEVATGFCRTGRLFACEHEGVQPDMLCLGKGLSGGYLPVAATMATQAIFDAFLGEPAEGKTFYHGHTFGGNALGCAAALASIDQISSSGLLEALPRKVELMRRRLATIAGHRHVADVRQCGLMAGVELMAHPPTRRRFDPARRVGAAVCKAAAAGGLVIRPLGDVVVLMPAPAMDEPTLGRMMDIAVRAIAEFDYAAAAPDAAGVYET